MPVSQFVRELDSIIRVEHIISIQFMDVIDHCENNFSKVLGESFWNPEEKRNNTMPLEFENKKLLLDKTKFLRSLEEFPEVR